MKATTFVAAAALLGSVSADEWAGWSNSTSVSYRTTTTSKPVEVTSQTTGGDPTWSEWDSTTTSSKPVKETSVDPSWGEWPSTSSTPVKETSRTSSSSKTDPSVWDPWSSTSTKPVEVTSKTASDYTWSEWDPSKASSTPVKITSTQTGTWANWDPTQTITSTSTHWITVTVFPVSGANGSWSAWSTSATPVVGKTTNTNTVTVSSTVTKTALSTPAASSDPSWGNWSSVSAPVAAVSSKPVADGQCAIQVSLSYGAPIWYPTPVIATSSSTPAKLTSTSKTDPASSWDAWSSATTSTPAKLTSTSKTDPASSWDAWSSATTSTPAKLTSTSKTDPASSWDAWSSATTSTPAKLTSISKTDPASSWDAWSSTTTSTSAEVASTASGFASWSALSQSEGGAFYTQGSSSASKKPSSTASAGWSSSTGAITSNGNKFGMTYSPYTSAGGCKDASTVAVDIAKMASMGFSSVRVYSTDCSTLENVGSAARSNKMKLILGVFISETGIEGARPQVDAIAKWAQWDLVELIVVGNEAVFQGRCSASDLAGFIASSKSAFQAAGFKGKVSTTDELSVWTSQGSAWCSVVDVVTANLYAFFNPATTAENAGSFIQAQIEELSKVCPGKEVYVMESGWPSAGECNGVACPSPENQATAIKGIQQSSGAKVVFFSYEDEQWKQPGQYGVEQHWGCANVFSSW